MEINFRKLKSQIRAWKPEVKAGYIFIATNEQKDNYIPSIAKPGSKRSLIKVLISFISEDEDWAKEFKL